MIETESQKFGTETGQKDLYFSTLILTQCELNKELSFDRHAKRPRTVLAIDDQ